MRALALALVGALAASPGAAQPGPRTGPDAAPPSLPAYATPLAPRVAPTPPSPGASPLTHRQLSRVVVTVAGSDGGATPLKDWRPPEDAGPGLALSHMPGQALDAAWVRSQFTANRSPEEGGAARALALVQAINRAYLSAGFINSGLVARSSTAPDVLALELILGGLSTDPAGRSDLSVVWVGGSDGGLSPAYLRARMPSARGRPLSAVDLERDFRLLAEDPAIRTLTADLRPGTRPGEASLALSVLPQERFELAVTGANNRSPSVGGERLSAAATLRNAAVPGDLLSFEAGVTDGLEDAALSYGAPLSPHLTAFIRANLNEAAVVDRELAPLDIEARDRAAEGGIHWRLSERPLLPAQGGGWRSAEALTVGVQASRRISRTYLLGQPFSFSPGAVEGRSAYTALRLVGDYVARNVDRVFAVSLTGTLGVGGTRSYLPGVISPKRDFKAALAQVNYARRLTSEGLELRARLTGQYASGTLYSGERLAAGGEASVRGYRETLVLGDRGAIASVEFARPIRPFGRASGSVFDWGAFTASVFADGAYMRNGRPPHPKKTLASAGASLAWSPSEALSFRVTYARALDRVQIAGERDLQDDGVHIRMTVYPLRFR